MKLSQAVDLYIQRKRDAGMRFDSPASILRSFLRHCGDIDLHHITVPASHRIPRRLGGKAQYLERQTRYAASLFRLLGSTRSAEILSAPALCSQNCAKLRSLYLLPIRLTLASRRRAAMPAEVRLCHVGSHIPYPVVVSVRNRHAARRSASAPAHGCGSDARSRYDTRYEIL